MKPTRIPTVYILKCRDNSYYIGITNNLNRRFNGHQHGFNPGSYTHDKRPVELVYHEIHPTFMIAINREKQLKRWSRAKKEALISGDMEKLKALSKSHGSTSSP